MLVTLGVKRLPACYCLPPIFVSTSKDEETPLFPYFEIPYTRRSYLVPGTKLSRVYFVVPCTSLLPSCEKLLL